jgi:predicted dithiol-disulfide oxidoreductase (DUF899 family)
MTNKQTVARDEWLAARLVLLEQEKALSRQRDAVTVARLGLPRVRVDKPYSFQTEDGEKTLADLFDGRDQLIVYHFMFGVDWEAGCPSCSLIADGFDGAVPHLAARGVSFKVVSRAPVEKLLAFRARMSWKFDWASAQDSDFNRDFHVAFTEDEAGKSTYYNYQEGAFPMTEAPGLSIFVRDEDSSVYHTYSAYARGLDALIGTYQYLDLTPKGRDEDGLDFSMAWVRHHDRYEDQE